MKEFITWVLSMWPILAVLGMGAIAFSAWVFKHDFGVKNKAVYKEEATSPKQSFAEVIHEAVHNKLRGSLISAKASAEQLLLIKTDAEIYDYKATARNLINDTYVRYGFAVQNLEKEHKHHQEFTSDLTPLMDLLKSGQANLNRIRRFKKTFDEESKSKVDKNTREIIRSIDNIIRIKSGDVKTEPITINVLDAYQSNRPLKQGLINIDVEFRVKTTKLPIRISKIQFLLGAKFIDANSPPMPFKQIAELESFVANFDLDYYLYLHSALTEGKYYLCVLTAGSKRITPILSIGNHETILKRNKPDGFNLVFNKAE